MGYIFVILLIAAVIGIFRPYKFLPQSKRWHYGLTAFACFVAIGVFGSELAPVPNRQSLQSASIVPPTQNGSQSPDPATETPSSKWTYDSQRDEMRSEVSEFASVNSENTIEFGFPYGEQPASITVRKNPQYGIDVMFGIPSGQILCHGFGDSYLNVKFDDGPIRRFDCNGSSDGTSEVSFIVNSRQFISALKESDRTIIEAEFYQAGRQQYIFDTHDLVWEE